LPTKSSTSRRARQQAGRRFERAERLRKGGAFAAADAAYRQILDLNPTHIAALRGRASAAEGQEHHGRAAALTAKADAQETDGHCTTAAAAFEGGSYLKALRCYQQALSIDDEYGEAVWGVAECYASLDDRGEAIRWYRRYLELEPDEPEALHMLAALGEGSAPDRASDAYVAALFDRFAPSFDRQLTGDLEYRAPEAIRDALQPVLGAPSAAMEILDLGCGTGLTGHALRPYVKRLDGVDLSQKMLNLARRRRLYDRLEKAEIGQYLETTRHRYDLVVAGDALIYFGSLDKVFAGIARVLRTGGHAAMTLEFMAENNFRLLESGRYAHSQPYVRLCAGIAGLTEVTVRREVLRLEYGDPVYGDVWVFCRA
jgi:predicted TPR repeat methyltransferase